MNQVRNIFAILLSIWIAQGLYMGVAGEDILYVSPDGNDTWSGTMEKPYATVSAAISKLKDKGGRIILLAGEYGEEVRIPASDDQIGGNQTLTIEALTSGEVVFTGGYKVTHWETWMGKSGLYLIKRGNVQRGSIGVWENKQRIRYREQADASGVEAFPGSYAVLDDDIVLVHVRNGDDPVTADLWISNGPEYGIIIDRARTVLRGIHFQHYLGVRKSGPILINANDVSVSGIKIRNSTTGILVQPDIQRTVITDSIIQDVGTGIYNLGDDTQVRNCLIESADGAFAIEVQQHVRNGIRWYYPAKGGVIENCLTAGFWAGLYIKTISENISRGARPVFVQHNTFLDGIKAGSGGGITQPQPFNRYLYNIIGPNEDRQNMQIVLSQAQATLEGNYFYHDKGDPFINWVAGDLRIRHEVQIPQNNQRKQAGAEIRQVNWSAGIRENLAGIASQRENLQFVKPPAYASSRYGARVTVYLNQKARVTLYYRKSGARNWETIEGRNRTFSHWESELIRVPIWERPLSIHRVGFSLVDGQLQPNANYEFLVKCMGGQDQVISTEVIKLKISGGNREIYVRTNSETDGDGSLQNPFSDLQRALDSALPGDTVRIAGGVYTHPVIIDGQGTNRDPIVIRGEGENRSILDGSKIYPVIVELHDANHVVLSDLQIRWFGRYGIYVKNSSNITVERCLFRNLPVGKRMSPNGMGIRLENAPECSILNCVFTTMEYGVDAVRSPKLVLRGNTAFLNLYSAVRLLNSCQDSEMTLNSFTFTGNHAVTIVEESLQNWRSLKSDYNNFGAILRQDTAKVRPENDFTAPARYAGTGMLASKNIVRVQLGGKVWQQFSRMKDWREFSGKDVNSIFADPQYVDPLRGDFKLLPSSPNRLSNGTQIGAIVH